MDSPNPNPPLPDIGLGLIHMYTGHGKGKTTASLGLALRAIGQGYKACMIQFLKGGKYTGEYISAHSNLKGLDMFQFGKECVKEEAQLKLDGFSRPDAGKRPHNPQNPKDQKTMVRGAGYCGDCRICFTINEAERQDTLKGFAFAKKVIASGEYDVIILDEICGAINVGIISVGEVIELAKSKSPDTELVLTGRDAPKELVEIADYVSDITHVRHPYDKGIQARRGIEF